METNWRKGFYRLLKLSILVSIFIGLLWYEHPPLVIREFVIAVEQQGKKIRSVGDNKTVQTNVNTFRFVSECQDNDLHVIRYSPQPNVNIPFLKPSQRKTKCPRDLSPVDFPTPFTALFSFPGSGNTWTRHLLQQLTGFHTGSSTKMDEALRENGFIFEGQLNRVIAVKTHGTPHKKFSNYVPINEFDRAIIIFRNPYDSFLADYKRVYSENNHTANVFINRTETTWQNFFPIRIRLWRRFIGEVEQFPGPTLNLFYEDFISDLLPQLVKIAEFLSNPDLYEFAFCCTVKHQEGNFHRPPNSETPNGVFKRREKITLNNLLRESASYVSAKYPDLSQRFLSFIQPV